MPKLIFVDHDGTERMIESPVDRSLMEAAINAGVPGVDADCGGACACATCHIYVDDAWLGMLEGPSDMEESMLECVSDPAPNSRLSCQIRVTDALDGLRVSTPRSQH